MKDRPLFVGLVVAAALCAALGALAFRRMPRFPAEDPLVDKPPANLDEWKEPGK